MTITQASAAPVKPSKTRRTKADWLNHIGAWESSGQTQQTYCQENGLCYRQFSQWKSRFKKEHNSSGSESIFAPVKVSSEPDVLSVDSVKVILPNKVEVILTNQSGHSSTLALIQQLATMSC